MKCKMVSYLECGFVLNITLSTGKRREGKGHWPMWYILEGDMRIKLKTEEMPFLCVPENNQHYFL